jgi:hypothetical protein
VDEPTFRRTLAEAGLTLTRFDPLMERTVRWYDRLLSSLDSALERLRTQARPTPPHLEPLRTEVATLLENLHEERVMPFFGEARPR